MVVKARHPVKVNRRVPGLFQATYRRHAIHVGEIAVAWNALQSGLFQVFWALVSPDNHAVAFGLWHCIQSDKTQREMLLAVAKAALSEGRMRRNVEWMCAKAELISPHRNDAAHTPISVYFGSTAGFSVIPNPMSTRTPAYQRLSAEPTDKLWRRVRGDLIALTNYAVTIAAEIREIGPLVPSPRRPRLLWKAASARKRSSPPAKARRGRPPKS